MFDSYRGSWGLPHRPHTVIQLAPSGVGTRAREGPAGHLQGAKLPQHRAAVAHPLLLGAAGTNRGQPRATKGGTNGYPSTSSPPVGDDNSTSHVVSEPISTAKG